MVELVASGLKREAQVLEIASNLATVPDVVAGSITSYAGGRFGQDSVRVGTAVRARGLTPNVHLTCVGQDRVTLRKTIKALRALGMFNVFALTGDWPAGSAAPPVFDLDSVQLIDLIAGIRQADDVPFHIAVAVSPFKYQREDCLYQYLKLEKKIAAGADMAITQVGWDVRKFRELKHYLDERGLTTPIFGNVYVLGRRSAEKMATANPPGCWVPPALVEEPARAPAAATPRAPGTGGRRTADGAGARRTSGSMLSHSLRLGRSPRITSRTFSKRTVTSLCSPSPSACGANDTFPSRS